MANRRAQPTRSYIKRSQRSIFLSIVLLVYLDDDALTSNLKGIQRKTKKMTMTRKKKRMRRKK